MAQNNIPVSEVYWSLVDKADRKFSMIRDLPYYGRTRYDSYFQKVFKVYTQLWKFQQENRQKLVEAGLKRWEIGEIASRIAQLYYGQYLRTSEASYLSESYIFYEAILSREYFKDGSLSQDLNLANKQLRCLARFLVVCLVLNRREMVQHLVNQLKLLVDECKRNFQETDFREWKQVLQEIVRFLKSDTAFLNTRPLRYSIVIDSNPDSLPHVASLEGKNSLRLREAILSSYHHNEVKFTELTLDTFRMLQCLEWEPSGSFYQTSASTSGNGTNSGHNGASGPNRPNYSQDITDPTLPPNPRKAILYRPAVTHFIAVLATISEELPPDGVLLIYISASGKSGQVISSPSSAGAINTTESTVGNLQTHNMIADTHRTPSLISQRDTPTHLYGQNKENHKSNLSGSLWMGSRGYGGSNCICPSDLIPFTRRPLFLIIDSDSSQSFKAIHGAEMGEPAAMLLSPTSPSPATSAAVDSSRHTSGSQFSMFLTAPLQAFCLLLGFSGSNINMDAYNEADKLLTSSLNEWGLILAKSDTLDPVWAQVLCDPFLRRILLRFIFCRVVLALYAPTFNKKEFLPDCLPHLPDSVLPTTTASQTAILQIANTFGVSNHFIFSDGITPPENGH
ncbi:Protein of unknown function DUF3550/UPF0682 [Macleaya cordata]|uniref:Protein SCAI n=1 Tax=Macleaya cordata TaxID=56857 RepID=A0A200PXL6_MACCD|nr:Protein of unknown function DUF3550/UPF0682 [Macleaya cordata]